MFVEQRTYTLVPGSQGEWIESYQKHALDIQTEILGRLIGYFTTEFGALNQVVHMWAYDSFEERAKRRKQLFQDPRWLEFIPKVRPLIVSQESKILMPTPFSPIR